MAIVRRAAVILLTATMMAAAAQPPGLTLAGGARPGSLNIANRGGGPVTIARAIGVERRDRDGWTAVHTEFNAVSSCPIPGRPVLAAKAAVSIPAGGNLKVVPWQGYTCSGQCENACMADIYLGPGTFRFVATVLPMGDRVTGLNFAMPPKH
ncbi:hypothetical protein KZX46_00140 (plasmid) [Polymorphobacter sp. PAMC 29334]|uniref:hypothetical protein n=1 Tax=Polymorphobacter sp. PAMC 29334 TaxID=2862331 RepID=UPI001C748FFF|nr:hypothetical protein [Polymorphobacter sp. PAMC 29334]QYE33266.1 hypothetical protein KZX46_00140 [Polymorphobacter sp. PAMC 29334]